METISMTTNLPLKSFFAFCSVLFYKDQRRKDGNDFNDNKLTFEKFLCLLQCFVLQGPKEERWKRFQ